jgi:hypothetical protein
MNGMRSVIGARDANGRGAKSQGKHGAAMSIGTRGGKESPASAYDHIFAIAMSGDMIFIGKLY